jgi:hypothetical protein
LAAAHVALLNHPVKVKLGPLFTLRQLLILTARARVRAVVVHIVIIGTLLQLITRCTFKLIDVTPISIIILLIYTISKIKLPLKCHIQNLNQPGRASGCTGSSLSAPSAAGLSGKCA